MDGTDRRAHARMAIQRIASEHELPTDLVILSERWNTVAKLGDSTIIAKAATLADMAKSDPLHWFQLEVDVCNTLSSRNLPAHMPLTDVVKIVDGLPITLWHEVDGEMGECTEEKLVRSLAALHQGGGDTLREYPWFATITTHFDDVFPSLRERQTIDDGVLTRLEYHYQHLMEQVDAANLANSFLHGDAQRKNAMRTADGAVWIDFEESSYGPTGWDLACLTMNRRFDTDRVLDRYAEISGMARIPTNAIETLKQLRDLEGLTWMLAIQNERDQTFRDETSNLLVEVLMTATAD